MSGFASRHRLVGTVLGVALLFVAVYAFATRDDRAESLDVARVDDATHPRAPSVALEAARTGDREQLEPPESELLVDDGGGAAVEAETAGTDATVPSTTQAESATGDELFEARYVNFTKEQLQATFASLRDEYDRVREFALDTKRTNRDVLETSVGDTSAPRVQVNAIRRTIISPVEVMAHEGGERIVWEIWLEPELYPDIYALRAEVDWLSRHAF
jgi:hypothetical protein